MPTCLLSQHRSSTLTAQQHQEFDRLTRTNRLHASQNPLLKIGIFVYGLLILLSITFYLLASLTLRDEMSLDGLAAAINQDSVERIFVYRSEGETLLTAELDDEQNTIIIDARLAGTGVNVPYEALTGAGAEPRAIESVTFTLAGDEAPHASQDLLREVRQGLEDAALPMSVVALLVVLALIRYKNAQENQGPAAIPARNPAPDHDEQKRGDA